MTMTTPNIRPLGDRLVVLPKDKETKTAGGIVIPDTADKDKPMQGTVIAIGNGKYMMAKCNHCKSKSANESYLVNMLAPASNSTKKNTSSCVKKMSWAFLNNLFIN